jgi:hypothetical protein
VRTFQKARHALSGKGPLLDLPPHPFVEQSSLASLLFPSCTMPAPSPKIQFFVKILWTARLGTKLSFKGKVLEAKLLYEEQSMILELHENGVAALIFEGRHNHFSHKRPVGNFGITFQQDRARETFQGQYHHSYPTKFQIQARSNRVFHYHQHQ